MYKNVLHEGFIKEYKKYHKILFRELNIMLFDVAFLKECISHSDIRLDTDVIISYLFRNNFEHLILKTYRIMFDMGTDVLTMDSFTKKIMRNLIDEDFKNNLSQRISNSSWKTDRIKAVKRRLKESLDEFRNKVIAHKLTKEMHECSVELNDISELLDSAIDMFDILSFYPLDFYETEISKYSYIAERLTVQEKSKQLLDLLRFSSSDIKHIDVQLDDMADEVDALKIQAVVEQYNKERIENDKCFDLLYESKISACIKISLLEIKEFKKELVKHENITDDKIIEIICGLKRQFTISADTDEIANYKLSVINFCLNNINFDAGKT